MYRLSTPAPDLAPFIESYWHVDTQPGAPFHLSVDVFVDGRADLVFNFGVPYMRTALGKAPRTLVRSNLDAQRLTPIHILQQGEVCIVGVRFRAGGLMPFVAHSLHDWTGAVVGISAAFGADARPLEKTLRDAPGDAGAQSVTLDAFFLSRLDFSAAKRSTHAMVREVAETPGALRVEELSLRAGLSPRSVDRLFRRHVGFGPKTWAQVVRFQRALSRLQSAPASPLSQVAAELGYYDQSHLVREYRRFAGQAPGRHAGFFPADAPRDFAPNVVRFVQDGQRP